MMKWKPIETAPKSRDYSMLLYWPSYAYNVGEQPEAVIAIGWWKSNSRLERHYSDGTPKHSKESLASIEGMAEAYFADNDEQDDYALALAQHAPTHWMPLPKPPLAQEPR